MSYWKFEKVASTKELIEKLMEYLLMKTRRAEDGTNDS